MTTTPENTTQGRYDIRLTCSHSSTCPLEANLEHQLSELHAHLDPLAALTPRGACERLNAIIRLLCADGSTPAIILDDYDDALLQKIAEGGADVSPLLRELMQTAHAAGAQVLVRGVMPPAFWPMLSTLRYLRHTSTADATAATPASEALSQLLQRLPAGVSLADRLPHSSLAAQSDSPLGAIPMLAATRLLEPDDDRAPFFTLRSPGRDSERELIRIIATHHTHHHSGWDFFALRHALSQGDIDSFLRRVRSLLSSVPYFLVHNGESERLYHIMVYLITTLSGTDCQCEYVTARGRIDLLVRTPRYIYIFEFKLNTPAEKALTQIDDHGYALPFDTDSRHIVHVGVTFSDRTHTIDSWHIKKQT